MKKKAIDLKSKDIIIVGGEKLTITEVEVSDVGKQGTRKVRIEVQKANGEKVVLIRPQDYPFEV